MKKIVFWRSRKCNPVNKWYFEKSDGYLKLGDWVLFWIGDGNGIEVSVLDVANFQEILSTIPASFN